MRNRSAGPTWLQRATDERLGRLAPRAGRSGINISREQVLDVCSVLLLAREAIVHLAAAVKRGNNRFVSTRLFRELPQTRQLITISQHVVIDHLQTSRLRTQLLRVFPCRLRKLGITSAKDFHAYRLRLLANRNQPLGPNRCCLNLLRPSLL